MELKKGETIMTDAALHLSASFLYEAFSDRSGVPLDFFELYYRGKRLEGESALASWGVGKGSTIEVKMRGRGGGNIEGKQPRLPEEEPSSSSNAEETSSGSKPPSASKVDAAGKLIQKAKNASGEGETVAATVLAETAAAAEAAEAAQAEAAEAPKVSTAPRRPYRTHCEYSPRPAARALHIRQLVPQPALCLAGATCVVEGRGDGGGRGR